MKTNTGSKRIYFEQDHLMLIKRVLPIYANK